MATTTTHGPIALASQSTKQDVQHNPRPYTPSPWGDFFLTHQPCTPAELLSMKEKAQARKEEVRRILLDAAASSDLARKLDLVYAAAAWSRLPLQEGDRRAASCRLR
jgi:hypothetical protein